MRILRLTENTLSDAGERPTVPRQRVAEMDFKMAAPGDTRDSLVAMIVAAHQIAAIAITVKARTANPVRLRAAGGAPASPIRGA